MRKTFLFILALCATTLAWGEDKTITETYVNAGTGASTSRVSFKSSFDENFTVWQRGGRSKTTDVVSIGGKDVKGFWLSRETSSSCYIEWGETNKQYLGGVKSVSFAYKQFGTEPNHTMILDIQVNGTSVDQISFPAGTSPYPTYTYSKDLNAKTLTKLTLKNLSTATEGTALKGRLVIGPVTITPYLYCPSSAQNVQYKVSESATYINPDFIDNTEGEATWSCAPEGIVTVADGVVTPIEGKSGKVVITAKLNDIEVSYNLEVIAKSTPEISFAQSAITITDLYTTDPVANELTVTEDAGEVSYTSSNPLVAKIVENQVMVVGVGTATITATAAENEDYLSASASYALTVNEPTGETAVSEDFDGKLPYATKYQTTAVNFTDQDGLYAWTVNGHRYDGTWVRFSTEPYACMTSQGVQEGGIKRLAFTWKRANGVCTKIHTTIKALDGDGNEIVDRSIELAGSEDQTSNQTYNMRFDEVKQNAQFYFRNESDGFVTLISDIKIVPYVLYTEKAQSTDAADETYDATTGLINNAPEGDVTFSIVTEDAQATIDEATGEVDMTNVTTSEDIVIKASYGDAYTTMNLHVNALPVPTVSFADGDAVEKDMNTVGYVNTLTRDGDGAVSYESSDETVAEVDAEGVITIIGEGVTTITAKVAACQTYTTAEASYELTITDPEDDAITETFERNGAGSSAADRVGAYYTWTITTGVRTRETDILFNKTPSIWLSGNGDASMETTIEGGIKRVGFLWNKFNKTANPISVSVIAGGVERTLTKEVQTGEAYNQNDPDLVFNSNFGIKSNTNLKIANPNPQNTTALQIGPIAITPYLLYTTKYDEVKLSKGSYVNTDIINNTKGDGTITFSAEPNGYVELQENLTYPGTFELLKAGEVTITATWIPSDAADGEIVTTSYVLKINDKEYMDARFETAGNFEKELGNTFTNAVTYTKGEGTATYSSDDTNVAEVDADGKVTIKGIGTTTIKAHLDATENYFAWDGSYILVVRTGVANDNKLVEHFVGLPTGLAPNEEYECEIAKWKANQIRRGANDTIGGSGVQGNNIHSTGSIYNTTEIEGGIKYFSFNWKQWANESVCTLKLHVKLGNSDYSMEKAGTELATYEHYFFAINAGIKSNVDIALYNESYNTDGPLTSDKGRITFDAFEIVPYLFYKTKYHKMDVANGDPETWTNTDLINNTDGGTIVYSVPEGNGVATIDPELGEVTAVGNGITTVTATWTPADPEDGEVVTTTYEVEVFYSKLDAELAFDPEEITVGVDAIAFSTPTLSNPHELTVKYSSSDETIATVDENSGVVTLIGVAGDVVISATSDATDTYQEGSASYKIHVLPLPDVTFPDLTGNKKTVDMDQVPFTETIWIKVNEEDVTSSATITYESSNEEVAVIKDGEVNIIGVGTAYITAKIAPKTGIYAGRDVCYTLTVEDNTPAGKQWTETFPGLSQSTYYDADAYTFTGKDSVYSWKMRTFRCQTDGNDDKVDDDQGIRIKYGKKNNYIEFDDKQEGGVKRVKFDWKQPGSELMAADLNIKIDNTVQDNLTLHRDVASKKVNSYNRNVFVKSNTKMTITVPAGGNAIIIGPITITPYLLYTKKVVEVTYDLEGENTVDATANLINNIDEGTVTYSLSEGAQAQIDGSTITLENVTEDITVTATWGEVSTTFTLKVTKAEDPVVEPDFVLSNKTAGALATICLPNKIDRIENGTLYSINYGDTKSIEFIEADLEKDNAGMPYLVQVAEAGDVNFYYAEGEPVEEPVDAETAKGFVGSLSDSNIDIPSDRTAILVSGGQLHIAGTNCVLTQNHAYIDATKLPTETEPVGAPRRTIRLYNPDAAPTNFNGLNGAVKPMKVLRDGQFYIIRETKTYNAQGILVE